MTARIVILTHDAPVSQIAQQASAVIRAGNLIIFPTDTVYGLGADPENEQAVTALFTAKGRAAEKPIAVLASDICQAKRWAVFSPMAETLAAAFWPGPLTLVLPPTPSAPAWLIKKGIGMRVPGDPFTRRLCDATGGLIATTSANLSDARAPESIDEFLAIFGEEAELIIFRQDAGVGTAASTVMDLCDDRPVLRRTGSITPTMIERILLEVGFS